MVGGRGGERQRPFSPHRRDEIGDGGDPRGWRRTAGARLKKIQRFDLAICLPTLYNYRFVTAGVAQLVEHLICNQRVGGSNPFASSSLASAAVTTVGRRASGQEAGAGFQKTFSQLLAATSAGPCRCLGPLATSKVPAPAMRSLEFIAGSCPNLPPALGDRHPISDRWPSG